MSSKQITIEANPYQQEELIALLSDYEPLGFEERDTELVAYFKEDKLDKNMYSILSGYTFSEESIEDKNWNEEWERNFQPVRVNDFAAIRADFHPPIKDVQYEIVITPKMSFGTGHHATTHMMIEQMEGIDFKDKEVFDFGTGTGILAILAEKLGAKSVEAIDVDDWSIENTLENFERNNCHHIQVELSSNIPPKQFDVILANINRNVILQYMDQLKKAVRDKGYILFSGLLTTDQDAIEEACKAVALKLIRYKERSNWISLLFVNE